MEQITRHGVKCTQKKSVNNFLLYGPLVSFTNLTFYNSTMKQLNYYNSKVSVTLHGAATQTVRCQGFQQSESACWMLACCATQKGIQLAA